MDNMKNTKPLLRATLVALLGDLEESREFQDRRSLVNLYHGRINQEDLVFTLKHDPTKYFRPQVRLNNDKLSVVGNTDFYRAVRESGFQEVHIDLLFKDKQEFSYILEKFALKPPQEIVKKHSRYLFFLGKLPIIDSRVVQRDYNAISRVQQYPETSCLFLDFSSDNAPEVNKQELDFLNNHARPNLLRSIDGLKKGGKYSPFIQV